MAVTEETSQKRSVKLALTCAPGGHFEQMQNLAELYRMYPYFWITMRTTQTEHALRRETTSVYFLTRAHFTEPWTYVRQIPHVWKILSKERPTHILSTGAGIVEFIPFLLSRLLKIKFIHIESFSRVNNPTIMGSFLLRLRHPILSQWDGIKHPRAISIGPIISDRKPFLKEPISEKIVFVTLGNRPQKFPRMLKTVEALIKDGVIREKVIAQIGSTDFRTALMDTFDFCNPEKMVEYIASSKYVITQESAGVVTKCLKLGKRFIVMPRAYQYRELPSKRDMEEDLHLELAEQGLTFVVHDQEQLREAIHSIGRLKTGFVFDNRQAIAYLENIIRQSHGPHA